ncbi:MAG TPA: Rrf2 family transcriptional regulator [Betaproteobacteria bacterium]|nr:Rrf2 family transcriptional regulator [Betaproteobacteria bacterium]
MILSRTSQYAIQAMIYVAMQPRDVVVLNRNIAQQLNVPAAYLAKVLQHLCKGNLLYSYRGRLGGFRLSDTAGKANLMQVLLLTEGPGFAEECLLGLKECSDETACPMHRRWKPIKQKIIDLLSSQTVEKLARAVQTGKYRLADLPGVVIGGGHS